jgi:cobalt-zinc-cadmium efflux system membrane fusion protein
VLKAMGKVLAPQPQMAIVGYAFPGRIAEIRTSVGQWVEKGQPLIVLESQDVGQAKSDYYKAIASHELAQLNLEREQRLLEGGIGLKKNLLAAEAEHKVAHVDLEAAEKRLHILGFTEKQVEEAACNHETNPTIILNAPITGKVVASEAILGKMVDPATEILRIVDIRSLWVDAEIYERDLAKVKDGQRVEIRVPAYPGETFTGTVTYIGDLVDEETRTITVRTEVANDDRRLKPGMFADVNLLLGGGEPVLIVPAAAVLEEGRRQVVFVKEQNGFRRREVETTILEGDCLQVVKGLAVGDEVVTQGNHQLRSVLERETLEAAHDH